jgi:undecaprenyl-diphosphatase
MLGFVAGVSEPLPVSAEAHRAILGKFFGVDQINPLILFFCHLAVLLVVLLCGNLELNRLRRTQKILKTPPRRRTGHPELNSAGTLKLLRTALPIVLVGRILGLYLSIVGRKLYLLSLTLILSGLILYLPARMRSANKDGRHLTRLDGMLMALGGALGAVPGISFVGAVMSLGLIRGTERRYALRFAWLLLCGFLCVSLGLDLMAFLGMGAKLNLTLILSAVAAGLSAAAGAWLAIRMMYALVRRAGIGISGFSYYNWGLALLCMALFLLV